MLIGGQKTGIYDTMTGIRNWGKNYWQIFNGTKKISSYFYLIFNCRDDKCKLPTENYTNTLFKEAVNLRETIRLYSNPNQNDTCLNIRLILVNWFRSVALS